MDMLLFTSMDRMLALTAVFLAVVIVVGAFVDRRSTIHRRVREMANPAVVTTSTSLRADATRTIWTKLIDQIERGGLSLADSKEDSLRNRLIAAGYTSTYAPRWFTLMRLALTIGLPTIYVTYVTVSGNIPSLMKIYIYGSIFALLGLYLPNVWISAKIDRRKQEITNGFPDALDLMLVCIEAGLGMEAAFDRVGREMTTSHPLVSDMLAGVVLEMRAGRNREEALRRMSDRTQVDEIRSFSTLLIQSDKLGASIGQTLRIYAGEMRASRRMRAEEKAHRLPVLISIPLVVCMLPVMIGVLMLPAAIRVIREIMPAMAGG
jgi:tight adherence protein C